MEFWLTRFGEVNLYINNQFSTYDTLWHLKYFFFVFNHKKFHPRLLFWADIFDVWGHTLIDNSEIISTLLASSSPSHHPLPECLFIPNNKAETLQRSKQWYSVECDSKRHNGDMVESGCLMQPMSIETICLCVDMGSPI